MNDVYRFEVEIEGDIYSGEEYPIYDESYKVLAGGFVLDKGNKILAFVSGSGHPAALFVSTGDKFYFTPKEDKNGKVSHGVVSDLPISPMSVIINNNSKGGTEDV